MTRPIYTTSEWFLASEKLPDDGSEVLIAYETGLVNYAEFLHLWHMNGDQEIIKPHFDDGDSVIWPEEIKYWSYLPDFKKD